jgi:hypothetical protein
MATLEINKHYNFSVYANAVLGTVYKNTKLVSILDYTTALKFANIELLNRQVYPYLPPGTLKDHTKYTYFLFQYKDKTIVLADVWILDNSVEETSGLNYTLKLNNITSTQLAIIRDQMRLLGIDFDIV